MIVVAGDAQCGVPPVVILPATSAASAAASARIPRMDWPGSIGPTKTEVGSWAVWTSRTVMSVPHQFADSGSRRMLIVLGPRMCRRDGPNRDQQAVVDRSQSHVLPVDLS